MWGLQCKLPIAVALPLNQLPIQFSADAGSLGDMDNAVFVDGKHSLHGEPEVFFRNKIFKVFAVADGAGYMEVHQVHEVHGSGVDLTVDPESFRHMAYLQGAGNAVFP